MKRVFLFLTMVSVIASFSVLYAGRSTLTEVYVVLNNDGSGYFYGTYNAARNSDDTIQYIGCNVTNNSSISCTANDEDSDYAYATSTNATYIEMVKSLSDYPYLYVRFDEDGVITYMSISKRSQYLPAD